MAAQTLLTLSLAVTLALITLSTRSTDAVQCYSCNTIVNPECFDPFNTSTVNHLVKCEGKACIKEKAIVEGRTLYVRTCQDDSGAALNQDQCTDVAAAGVSTRICLCSRDLCNAAAGLYATALWTAGAAAVALYGARR